MEINSSSLDNSLHSFSSISLLCSDFSEDYSEIDHLDHEILRLQILKGKLQALQHEKNEIYHKFNPALSNNRKTILQVEKNLLITEIKMQRMLATFNRKSEYSCQLSKGVVNISGVKLLLNNMDNAQFYLCFIMSEERLIVSKIAQANPGGVIDFALDFTFRNLPPDFNLNLHIYKLTLKESTTNNRNLICCQHRDKQEEIYYFRESLFEFWQRVNINISHANKSLQLSLPQFCILTLEVRGGIDEINVTYSGWVDISRNRGLFWNKRWCLLHGTKLQYFDYPLDAFYTNPINVIDLKSCCSLIIPSNNEACRNNTLVLDVKETEKTSYWFLSFDSKQELECWRKHLENLLAILQAWKHIF